jgi:hypothetical protein
LRGNDQINPSQSFFVGVTLSGEAKREAPAQAELRPTCAGTSMSTSWLPLFSRAVLVLVIDSPEFQNSRPLITNN